MKAKYKFEWDYLGFKDLKSFESGYTQNDWNQTLFSLINRCSANIFKESFRGVGNRIYAHPKTFLLISKNEYYDKTTNTLSGRYKIIVDDKLPNNKIYVKHVDEQLESIVEKNPNLKMAFKKCVSSGDSMVEMKLKVVDVRDVKNGVTEDGFTVITDEMLTGEITIKNQHTIDPETGEIVFDYFNDLEITEEIWLPTPLKEGEDFDPIPYDKEVLGAVLPNSLHTSFVNHGILKDERKMTFVIPVKDIPEEETKSFIKKIKEMIKFKNDD